MPDSPEPSAPDVHPRNADETWSADRTSVRELPPGSILGEFEILEPLGRGGAGVVYLARQQSLDRLAAVKVAADVGQDEGRKLAVLEHDRIVPVFTEFTCRGDRVTAMRFVDGCSLAAVLNEFQNCNRREAPHQALIDCIARQRASRRAEGRDSQRKTESEPSPYSDDHPGGERDALSVASESGGLQESWRSIILDVAAALEHAHARGVLHCDVKPENILLDQRGRAMLTDFNTSVDTTAPVDGSNWNDNRPIGGTPAYAAPEHLALLVGQKVDDDSTVDARSDLYALGLVYYELLTGRVPFRSNLAATGTERTTLVMLAERLQGPDESAWAGDVIPDNVRPILERLLAPRPDDRYDAATRLIRDLQDVARSNGVATTTADSAAARPRMRSVRATIVTVLVATIAASCAWYYFRTTERTRLERAAGLIVQANDSFDQPADERRDDVLLEAESLLKSGPSWFSDSRLAGLRARVHHDLGLALAARGRLRPAAVQLEAAVESNPDLASAWNNLGVVYYQDARHAEAVDAFSRALELGMPTAELFANRAAARFITGDAVGAETDVRQALSIDPDSPAALRNLKLITAGKH